MPINCTGSSVNVYASNGVQSPAEATLSPGRYLMRYAAGALGFSADPDMYNHDDGGDLGVLQYKLPGGSSWMRGPGAWSTQMYTFNAAQAEANSLGLNPVLFSTAGGTASFRMNGGRNDLPGMVTLCLDRLADSAQYLSVDAANSTPATITLPPGRYTVEYFAGASQHVGLLDLNGNLVHRWNKICEPGNAPWGFALVYKIGEGSWLLGPGSWSATGYSTAYAAETASVGQNNVAFTLTSTTTVSFLINDNSGDHWNNLGRIILRITGAQSARCDISATVQANNTDPVSVTLDAGRYIMRYVGGGFNRLAQMTNRWNYQGAEFLGALVYRLPAQFWSLGPGAWPQGQGMTLGYPDIAEAEARSLAVNPLLFTVGDAAEIQLLMKDRDTDVGEREGAVEVCFERMADGCLYVSVDSTVESGASVTLPPGNFTIRYYAGAVAPRGLYNYWNEISQSTGNPPDGWALQYRVGTGPWQRGPGTWYNIGSAPQYASAAEAASIGVNDRAISLTEQTTVQFRINDDSQSYYKHWGKIILQICGDFTPGDLYAPLYDCLITQPDGQVTPGLCGDLQGCHKNVCIDTSRVPWRPYYQGDTGNKCYGCFEERDGLLCAKFLPQTGCGCARAQRILVWREGSASYPTYPNELTASLSRYVELATAAGAIVDTEKQWTGRLRDYKIVFCYLAEFDPVWWAEMMSGTWDGVLLINGEWWLPLEYNPNTILPWREADEWISSQANLTGMNFRRDDIYRDIQNFYSECYECPTYEYDAIVTPGFEHLLGGFSSYKCNRCASTYVLDPKPPGITASGVLSTVQGRRGAHNGFGLYTADQNLYTANHLVYAVRNRTLMLLVCDCNWLADLPLRVGNSGYPSDARPGQWQLLCSSWIGGCNFSNPVGFSEPVPLAMPLVDLSAASTQAPAGGDVFTSAGVLPQE